MLDIFPVKISAFRQERTVRVYLPTNYHVDTKHYPVLYMHDGQNVFEDEGAIKGVSLGLKDYLDSNKWEIIVVAIDLNVEGEERINEYCPWINGETAAKILGYKSTSGGKGEAYVEFIIQELKPLIDCKYRTLPNDTAMAGISLGGLISTYAACRYPHVFKRVAALSPGYYRNQEEIEKYIKSSDLSAIERFYMDFGTKEAGDNNELFMNLISGVNDLLSEKIENTSFQTIQDGEHNYPSFRKRMPDILSYLYPKKGMAD